MEYLLRLGRILRESTNCQDIAASADQKSADTGQEKLKEKKKKKLETYCTVYTIHTSLCYATLSSILIFRGTNKIIHADARLLQLCFYDNKLRYFCCNEKRLHNTEKPVLIRNVIQQNSKHFN